MIHTKSTLNLGSLRVNKPQPPPRAGTEFVPLKHSILIDEIERQIKLQGWPYECWTIYVTQSQREMTAGIDVYYPDDSLDTIGGTLSIATVNSNNGVSATKLYGGIHLVKEGVGIPLYETGLGRHNAELIIQLGERVNKGLEEITTQIPTWLPLVRSLQRKQIEYNTINRVILQQAKQRLIGYSQLKPIYDQLKAGEPIDCWSLLLIYAKAVQKIRPLLQLRSTLTLVRQLQKETR